MQQDPKLQKQIRLEEEQAEKNMLPKLKIQEHGEKKFSLPANVVNDLDDFLKGFRDG